VSDVCDALGGNVTVCPPCVGNCRPRHFVHVDLVRSAATADEDAEAKDLGAAFGHS
jgi:hypothetical protein